MKQASGGPHPTPHPLSTQHTAHVEKQLGSLCGRKDHGDKPRRRDRKTTTWMNCNRGKSAVFCSRRQQAANSQRAVTVGAPSLSPRQHLRMCTTTQQGHQQPEIEQQRGNLCGVHNSLDHGDQPPQHEQDVDDQRRTATAETPQFSAV